MKRFAASRILTLLSLFVALFAIAVNGSAPNQQVAAASNGRIIYSGQDVSSNFQIHSINTDGTDDRELTNDAYSHFFPSYSPDGEKIIFMGQPFPSGNGQIMTMNADGSNQVNITNDDTGYYQTPSWSPDGSMVAYSRIPDDFSTSFTLYVSNADGSNPLALTDGTSNSESPSWKNDGSKLAYVCNGDQICVINKDGTNNIQLTSGSSNHLTPSFSPDGTQIAYTNIATGYVQTIVVMNADGSNAHTITTSGTSNNNVSWSPDGTKILYDNFDSIQSVQRVYYINLDGTGETVVSPDNQYAWFPAWQPIPAADSDGDGIASSIEAAGPNNGDANGDGIADKNQASVASFLDSITANYVSIHSTCSTTSAASAMAVPSAYKDAAFSYPAGLLNFSLICNTPGTTATITQYYYGIPSSATMVLRKYNNTSHGYATVSGTTISTTSLGGKVATKASYQVTDGGSLDQDGAINGIIIDPVGLASPSVGAPNTGFGGRTILPWLSAAPSL